MAQSVCLDGPKRDRLVWLGDFYHTAQILAVSTSRVDHSRGTLHFLLDSQIANGQLNISLNLGYDVKAAAAAMSAPAGSFGPPDYQILGLISFSDHVRLHNDVEWARDTWEGWQRTIDWLLGTVNTTTGLITLPSPFAFIGGPDVGSPVSCVAVQALRGVADVAAAVGDADSAERYTAVASSLAGAINEKLWNDDIGAYSLSIYNATSISVPGTAFCITSGVASADRTARSISALSALRLGPGYKDTSAVSSSDPSVNISPNNNGFLLSAQSWVLAPESGARLGLKEANATVVTAFGDLSVEWRVEEGQSVSATIRAPADTSGSFVYGDHVVELSLYVTVVCRYLHMICHKMKPAMVFLRCAGAVSEARNKV